MTLSLPLLFGSFGFLTLAPALIRVQYPGGGTGTLRVYNVSLKHFLKYRIFEQQL
jgi:hypothetical protein